MKVMIAGGGTGGHVYPGIAVAEEIRRIRPGFEVVFVGGRRGLEAQAVPEAGFRLRTIATRGFPRRAWSALEQRGAARGSEHWINDCWQTCPLEQPADGACHGRGPQHPHLDGADGFFFEERLGGLERECGRERLESMHPARRLRSERGRDAQRARAAGANGFRIGQETRAAARVETRQDEHARDVALLRDVIASALPVGLTRSTLPRPRRFDQRAVEQQLLVAGHQLGVPLDADREPVR